MNGDLALEVQAAVYAALVNDPILRQYIEAEDGTYRIYDTVPDACEFEYIVIGDASWSDHGDKTDPGQDGIFTLHVWTRQKGNRNLYLIGRQITRIFHEQPLVLTSGQVTLCRNVFTQIMPDGINRHLVKNFRIVVSDPATPTTP